MFQNKEISKQLEKIEALLKNLKTEIAVLRITMEKKSEK